MEFLFQLSHLAAADIQDEILDILTSLKISQQILGIMLCFEVPLFSFAVLMTELTHKLLYPSSKCEIQTAEPQKNKPQNIEVKNTMLILSKTSAVRNSLFDIRYSTTKRILLAKSGTAEYGQKGLFLFKVFDSVAENLYAVTFFRIGLPAATIVLLYAGPIRVIGPVIESLRVRHNSEYPPGRVANAGNIL
jgi:hypothetical protein